MPVTVVAFIDMVPVDARMWLYGGAPLTQVDVRSSIAVSTRVSAQHEIPAPRSWYAVPPLDHHLHRSRVHCGRRTADAGQPPHQPAGMGLGDERLLSFL